MDINLKAKFLVCITNSESMHDCVEIYCALDGEQATCRVHLTREIWIKSWKKIIWWCPNGEKSLPAALR